MNIKPSNPKDNVGSRKPGIGTIPVPVLLEVGLALKEGALKYGAHNWRVIGVRASVYYEAAFRHLGAWWEGEDIDPDSGLSHITKAIACLTVFRDAMIQENWTDDRPPKAKPFMAELNDRMKELLDRYPDPKAPFTEVSQRASQPATETAADSETPSRYEPEESELLDHLMTTLFLPLRLWPPSAKEFLENTMSDYAIPEPLDCRQQPAQCGSGQKMKRRHTEERLKLHTPPQDGTAMPDRSCHPPQ